MTDCSKRTRIGAGGFTLVETIIFLMVVTISLLTIFSQLSNVLHRVSIPLEGTQGLLLAKGKIEMLSKDYRPKELDGINGPMTCSSADYPAEDPIQSGDALLGNYARRVFCTQPVISGTTADCKTSGSAM